MASRKAITYTAVKQPMLSMVTLPIIKINDGGDSDDSDDVSVNDIDAELGQQPDHGEECKAGCSHNERGKLESRLSKYFTRHSTFLVVSTRLGKIYIYRFNKAKSLWLFGPYNPLRKFTIYFITNQIFEFFVIFTILVNCVVLALENAPEEAEYAFTVIYTIEMILKIVAKGFALHTFAYLRDPWNWLDFVVVILGYITLVPGVVNFSGIRTFRVLRALRTISAIEGLKTMVNALLKSMKMLSDVLLLTAFFLCVFALVGLQLFSGVFHNRCIPQGLVNGTNLEEVKNSDNWHPEVKICGNNTGSMSCPTNYTCKSDIGPNPNYAYTSFDDFGWSLLTSFQLVTLDYWEDVYFHTASALGPWYIFFFMMVIFFGSFYLINLVLAVVAVSYQQETAHDVDLENQYEFLRSIASSYSIHGKIFPKVIFDDPTIDTVNNLPCIKTGPSVIILSQKQIKKTIKAQEKMTLAKVSGRNSVEKSSWIAKRKLNNIINRVQVDRENEKLKNCNVMKKNDDKLNVSNVRSTGRTLRVPKMNDLKKGNGAVNRPSISRKNSFKLRMTELALADDLQSQIPVPYSQINNMDLTILKKFRREVYWLVMNPWFELGVTICILLNTICLALEYHGMDRNFKKALDISNHIFTAIFLAEMVLKLVAFTVNWYIKSKWNLFDGMIVLMSVIDLIFELSTLTNNGDFTIIRSLRLMRVLKLAQSWSTMRLLLSAIGRSISAIGNLTLILTIIVYMFAVVGNKVFGKKFKGEKFPSGKVPVWNFSDFHHSIMVIFRVLCGEWIEPLYDTMLVSGTWSIAFFIPALVVGNFLVLNLFLALLLNSFADQAMEEELKKKNFMKSKLKWLSGTRKLAKIQKAFKAHKVSPGHSELHNNSLGGKADDGKLEESISEDMKTSTDSEPKSISTGSTNGNDKQSNGCWVKFNQLCSYVSCCEKVKKRKLDFSVTQIKIKHIIENKYFETCVLVLIFASSLVLVFEDIHLASKPLLQKSLNVLNIVFCLLFVIEFLLKLLGLGFRRFVRNPWNCLDFLIVAVSIASVVIGFMHKNTNLKTLRSLRTLRALRPLRAVSRWDGMKIVVNSLLKAIPSIGNVLLVCLLFWLIFSILGVQFFGGRFYKCIDARDMRISADVIPNKTMCELKGHRWRNSNVNFDNALNGFLPLLQVATFEGWMEVMRDAVDATGVDQQPVPDHNFLAYFYFIVFIIIGSFFILNLFISVIIDNFYRLKKQYDDYGTIEVFLTPEQKQWFSTVKKALSKKPKRIINRPQGYYHSKIFDLVLSPKFETVSILLILNNIILMMVQHYGQSQNISQMLHHVNLVFTIIFTVEIALRIICLRHQYFLDRWNIFDLLIVTLSIVGIILEYLNVVLSVTPSVLRVARVLRIGRLLRFFNSAKGIRRLLVALVISLPALLNIGALLFLILFIYAIIGMSNFGYVKKHGALNDVVNFETFGNSMVVLFRLATSAGWNEVLDALMVQPPDCDIDYKNIPNGNCSTPWIAVVYLASFILFTFLIIVNMYIAVILENFNQAHEQEEIGITDEDIEMFYAVWQLYDPTATQYIAFEKLPYLVANLGAPLGIPFPNKVAVHNLDLPMFEGDKIHCVDVLQSLLKRVLGGVGGADTENFDKMRKTIDMKLKDAFPSRLKDIKKTTTMQRFQEVKAASVIQKHFRSWKKRRKNEEDNLFVVKHSIDNVFSTIISKTRRKRLNSASKLTGEGKGSLEPRSLFGKSPFFRRRTDSKLVNRLMTSASLDSQKDEPTCSSSTSKTAQLNRRFNKLLRQRPFSADCSPSAERKSHEEKRKSCDVSQRHLTPASAEFLSSIFKRKTMRSMSTHSSQESDDFFHSDSKDDDSAAHQWNKDGRKRGIRILCKSSTIHSESHLTVRTNDVSDSTELNAYCVSEGTGEEKAKKAESHFVIINDFSQ